MGIFSIGKYLRDTAGNLIRALDIDRGEKGKTVRRGRVKSSPALGWVIKELKESDISGVLLCLLTQLTALLSVYCNNALPNREGIHLSGRVASSPRKMAPEVITTPLHSLNIKY